MKKIISTVLVLALTLSMFTACGNDGKDNSTEPTPTPVVTGEAGGNNQKDGDISYTISDKVFADSYPSIPTDGVDITDEMCESAIVNEGNLQRLASVMAKASAGEDITIAYIGGSITDGSSATPQEKNCYAGLTQVWWEYTFQDCNINYVNAGIGATDSYIGVHRATDDVISYNPDLVVVEFSVNDYQSWNQETYESLLRMLLNSDSQPAVVSLVLCTKTSTYANEHYAVAAKLGVPCVSYAKVAQANMSDGTWDWSQLGTSDNTHPNNGGHSVIAHLLTYFYNKVLYSIPDSKYVEYEVPEETVTLSRYENADIIYSDEISATSMDGFEAVNISSSLFNNNGWKTTTSGTITFDVEAENVGLIYWRTTDGLSGQFDIYVNGEYATTIDGNFPNGWGNYAEYAEIGKYPANEGLTITIQPKEGSTGDVLSILALTVS